MNYKIYFLAIGIALVGTSCKKEKEKGPGVIDNTITQSEDNNDLKSESDQANSDVTDATSNFGRAKINTIVV
jgi:hypothetical protein